MRNTAVTAPSCWLVHEAVILPEDPVRRVMAKPNMFRVSTAVLIRASELAADISEVEAFIGVVRVVYTTVILICFSPSY